MPTEMPAQKTPCTPGQMIVALGGCWKKYTGLDPSESVKALRLLTAQWSLETGRGASCMCWNLGNVKSVEGDGYDYTFFACGEILGSDPAHRAANSSPLIAIKWDNGTTAEVEVQPKHPWCRFRAFASLEAGASDWLQLMIGRFHGAWDELLGGDPHAFAVALHTLRYFTADPAQYGNTLAALYDEFSYLFPTGEHFDLDTTEGLQGALFSVGDYGGRIDGVPGPMLLASIRAFQRDHGLVQDGLAGPKTKTAIALELQKR